MIKKKKKRTYKKSTSKKSKNIFLSKTLSIVWDILFYIFLLTIIIGAIFFNFNDSPNKSFFGYRFMTVLTNSMSPNPEKPHLKDGFTSGSIIVIKQVDPKDIKKGDIITFYPVKGNTEAYLTHRVIELMDTNTEYESGFLKTQGDANTGEDIPIESDQIVGKVIFSIPLMGNMLDFIRENLVIVSTFTSLLFGFLMMLKYYLTMNPEKNTKPKKGKRKKRVSH